ncbi:MAG: hypothetical protein JSW47_18085 [Phycisphaerales bacterium]|nr:MAG: hypothetical protein JSW47_18085 [Phycisphaerales bacterium]
MAYTVQYDSNQYILYSEGRVACTPAGSEIKTRFPALLREVLEDLKIYGPDPTVAISVYNLMCSYADFGRRTSKSGLIEAIFSDLKIDIIFDLPADPDACRFLCACYDNDLFDRLGIRPSSTQPDLKKLEKVLYPELCVLSKRALTVVGMFAANLGSVLLGMALVTDSIDLVCLAQSYCRRLYDYLGELSDPVAAGDTTSSWKYEPYEYDELYCNSVCCAGSGYDFPFRGLTFSCTVVQMFDRIQGFCRFPDE